MNKFLAMAAVVATMTACTSLSNGSAGDGSSTAAGATEAATLGYHGPRYRNPSQYGN